MGQIIGNDTYIDISNPGLFTIICIFIAVLCMPIHLLEPGEEIGWRGYVLWFQVEKYGTRKAVYIKADEYHSAYIMNTEKDYGNPMLAIGMNYIKFAIEERNLFRFLFQSNEFSGVSMLELLESEEMLPLLSMLQNKLDMSMEDTMEVFSTLFIFAHGYASLYANNTMIYDETNVIRALDNIFGGVVCAVKGDYNEKDI